MTTSFPVTSTASQSGVRAEHVRFAGFAAIVAAIVHFVYTILLTQVFPVGPDGLFPTGTFAFRVDGVISVSIPASTSSRWRRASVTRVGLAGLVAALPIGAPIAIALEPVVDQSSWLVVVALIAAGWFAIGLDLRARPSSEAEAAAVAA